MMAARADFVNCQGMTPIRPQAEEPALAARVRRLRSVLEGRP